jgi:hypothetical protein
MGVQTSKQKGLEIEEKEEKELDVNELEEMEADIELEETDSIVLESMNKSLELDFDGMPLAPEIVLTSKQGAYSVFSSAISQADSWHPPTDKEKQLTVQLLSNFKLSKEKGISKETTQNIMDAANGLGLKVCRVKTFKMVDKVKVPDSYLLIYTKPGVKNYSGAFFMLRETKHSNVLIISPHDDSDGTYADTKIGMSESYALATISNGHKRKSIKNVKDSRKTDFVHSTDNLGTFAISQFCRLFPGLACLHIHGMVSKTKCMYSSRNKEMGRVFERALKKNSKISEFTSLPVSFTIDDKVNTNRYIKTEMPASVHQNNKAIIKNVVIEMEKNSWCW